MLVGKVNWIKKAFSCVGIHQNCLVMAGVGLLLAVLFYYSAMTLSISNQIFLSSGVFFFLLCFRWSQPWLKDFSRVAVVMLSAYLSMRYWFFRTTQTLTYTTYMDFIFLMLLYLAESYGIFTHLLGMFVYISPLKRKIPPWPEDHSRLPSVDVYIPTYNESFDIVENTVLAATRLIYPQDKLKVFILDDGGTYCKLNDPDPRKAAAAAERAQQLKTMANHLGAYYLTRKDNIHAKAGNINAALMGTAVPGGSADTATAAGAQPASHGELILVLDCDNVPTKDFLQHTIGFFLADKNLAFVQTPHFFINPTPMEKNLKTHRHSPQENEMFYGGVHLGLDYWNASFFCGSAAVLRRKHLVEVGGLSCNTITEDAATALKLHSRGYGSVFINKPMIMGLSPESFDSLIVQRSRWAQGMTQILMLQNPLFRKGLSLAQRMCYFNACLYWLFGLARIILFLAPLMFIFLNLRVYNASLMQVVAYAIPHLIGSYFVSNFLYGNLRHPFFSELFETIQSIFLAPAVLSVFLRPRSPRFRVTPKAASLEKDSLSRLAAPFYVMLVLAIAAYPIAAWRYMNNPTLIDTITICTIWNSFNLLLVLCSLGVVWESKQLRSAHRYSALQQVNLEPPAADLSETATLVDLSTAGVSVIAKKGIYAEGQKLTLNAVDSYGNVFHLPIQIVRRAEVKEGTLFGCRFDTTKDSIRRQIIEFVYGDSRRLKYFYQTGTKTRRSSFRGFYNLVGFGLGGFHRNAKGLFDMLSRSPAK